MKKRDTVLSFVALFYMACALLAGPASGNNSAQNENPALPHGQTVTAANLRSFQDAALKGDAASALGVAMYYFLNQPTKSPDDDTQSIRWMQLAAENGSPMAMKLYASALNFKAGYDNCLRAQYWVRKAIVGLRRSKDIRDAKYLLQEIEGNAACKKP